jgi:hypothetical protein
VGASANLRGSLYSQTLDLPFGVEGFIGANAAHAPYIEYGTKPHFPNPDAIVGWVQAKMGLRGKEAVSVAWRVARKIAKRGTKAQQPFKKTADAYKGLVERRISEVAARIAQHVTGGTT